MDETGQQIDDRVSLLNDVHIKINLGANVSLNICMMTWNVKETHEQPVTDY